MLQANGYGLEVDIWAMGCVLYQLIGMWCDQHVATLGPGRSDVDPVPCSARAAVRCARVQGHVHDWRDHGEAEDNDLHGSVSASQHALPREGPSFILCYSI